MSRPPALGSPRFFRMAFMILREGIKYRRYQRKLRKRLGHIR